MNRIDLIAGCLLTVFSIAMIFVVIPMSTEPGLYYGLPPTFFPQLLSGGLALCSVGLVFQSLRRLRAEGRGAPVPISLFNLLVFAVLVAVLFAGILAIDWFGMVIAAPLLIAALVLILAERNPIRVLATAIVPVALIYGLAIHVLHTPLP